MTWVVRWITVTWIKVTCQNMPWRLLNPHRVLPFGRPWRCREKRVTILTSDQDSVTRLGHWYIDEGLGLIRVYAPPPSGGEDHHDSASGHEAPPPLHHPQQQDRDVFGCTTLLLLHHHHLLLVRPASNLLHLCLLPLIHAAHSYVSRLGSGGHTRTEKGRSVHKIHKCALKPQSFFTELFLVFPSWLK